MTLPRTTFDQRRPYYQDLTDLLTTGFLCQRVRVGDVEFSLRNVQPRDLFLIEQRSGVESSDLSWARWLVAHTIWMMSGYILLEDGNAPVQLHRSLSHLPQRTLYQLVHLVGDLSSRVVGATKSLEAYLYENESRSMWFQWRNQQMPSMKVSGIPGASSIGMNVVQRLWWAYNTTEDKRDDERTLWSAAKVIASAAAPKAIEKLNSREKTAERREEDRRQRVQDLFYYKAIGQLDEEGKDALGHDGIVFELPSYDDLADDMRRWIVGEFDWHDQVVDAYKKHVIEQQEQAQRERVARLLVLQREMEDEGLEDEAVVVQQLVGYTPEQMKDVLAQRGSPKPGVKTIIDSNEQPDYVYEKYLQKPPTSGNLQVEGDQIKVKGEDRPGLNQELAGRQVRMQPGSRRFQ